MNSVGHLQISKCFGEEAATSTASASSQEEKPMSPASFLNRS